MHVAVIGAGIIGVTTAHALRQQGFEVTVIDRRSGVAQEASFANAGVLAPAYVGPWAQPGMPAKVFAYLFRPEAPVVFRPSLDPALWRWLRRWLGECAVERFRVNRERMQRLAYYSRSCLHEVRERHGIDYEQGKGYLQLFRTAHELERTAPARDMLRAAGVPHSLLDAAACRALEPALAAHTPLAGGLHLPEDETGNCAVFARRLKGICESDGVRFRFGAEALRFDVAAGHIQGVQLADGRMQADAYVLAAGADSGRLLAPAGIDLPLMAVRGYSATATIARAEYAPTLAVMDESYKVAITRLGQRLRAAGTAEVGSRGTKLRESALRTLLKVARDWFPAAASYAQARFWVGARPMLPDGPPVLGRTPYPNLFLNVGHGSTGWAMACGSARIVADLIAGRPPQIDLDGLTLDRYAPRRAAPRPAHAGA
ncbi:MAG: D-amino acid dehydrogenase [Pseudomonadota bacterium]